jgi:glutathione S-transferase
MKLIGAIASPYVTRVVMYARIKGVDLPLESPPEGTPASDGYRAMNPIGKIPCLEVDGRILAESEVICAYLEDAYPEKSGLPADHLDRGTSRLISRIVDLYISPQVGPMFRQLNPANRDAAAIEAAAGEFAKAFGFVEHFMSDGPFCVGTEPTLGDCALAPHMMLLKKTVFEHIKEIPDPTEGDSRLAQWWAAIQADPICRETVEEYATSVDSFMKAMGQRIINR